MSGSIYLLLWSGSLSAPYVHVVGPMDGTVEDAVATALLLTYLASGEVTAQAHGGAPDDYVASGAVTQYPERGGVVEYEGSGTVAEVVGGAV